MADYHPSLEPFPLFIDAAPPNSANYFTSPMAMASIQLLATSTSSSTYKSKSRRPRVSMPTKVSNYLRLRYYQYEVTFGLYMMTPTERTIFNMIILIAVGALLSALFWGFQPFIINGVCRLLYYITGSFSSAPQICT